MVERVCYRCGMPRNEWKGNNGEGYTIEGQSYCCVACAEDRECTCIPVPSREGV
jgi:hypothetical protein